MTYWHNSVFVFLQSAGLRQTQAYVAPAVLGLQQQAASSIEHVRVPVHTPLHCVAALSVASATAAQAPSAATTAKNSPSLED